MCDSAKYPSFVRTAVILFIIIGGMTLVIGPVCAMRNPSAVYCKVLGYRYTDRIGSDGSMTGYCTISDNQSVDAWQFFEGKVAQDASYCKKQGYQIRTVTDRRICPELISDTCAVCILPDGSVSEVTHLMNLDFSENICVGTECTVTPTSTPDYTTNKGINPAALFLPVLFVLIFIMIVVIMYRRTRWKK
jgi:putative hemolysin